MNVESMIRAWKDPELRGKYKTSDHPAGPAEVPDEVLRQIGGGTSNNGCGTTRGTAGGGTPCLKCQF